MVTKSVLSSEISFTGYTELKAKLTAYQVELQHDGDIECGQAVYSKSVKIGHFQKPSNYSRKGVASGARSESVKGRFAGYCHYCRKPRNKIREC